MEYHKQHLLERQALERSKPLLVLSAKFCMVRQTDRQIGSQPGGATGQSAFAIHISIGCAGINQRGCLETVWRWCGCAGCGGRPVLQMRENVSVVDEDADGNKDVPFKVGVRIRSNRSKAPGGDAASSSSPIYVLRSVIKNSSGSARCQLWQM